MFTQIQHLAGGDKKLEGDKKFNRAGNHLHAVT